MTNIGKQIPATLKKRVETVDDYGQKLFDYVDSNIRLELKVNNSSLQSQNANTNEVNSITYEGHCRIQYDIEVDDIIEVSTTNHLNGLYTIVSLFKNQKYYKLNLETREDLEGA